MHAWDRQYLLYEFVDEVWGPFTSAPWKIPNERPERKHYNLWRPRKGSSRRGLTRLTGRQMKSGQLHSRQPTDERVRSINLSTTSINALIGIENAVALRTQSILTILELLMTCTTGEDQANFFDWISLPFINMIRSSLGTITVLSVRTTSGIGQSFLSQWSTKPWVSVMKCRREYHESEHETYEFRSCLREWTETTMHIAPDILANVCFSNIVSRRSSWLC